jgi:hypothetical protein
MPRVVGTALATGLTARYSVRPRGGVGFGATFTDGAVTVGPTPPSRPDCTILTEPTTFLLMALEPPEPVGGHGPRHVLAWGRKPWLAPRFPRLFTAPWPTPCRAGPSMRRAHSAAEDGDACPLWAGAFR